MKSVRHIITYVNIYIVWYACFHVFFIIIVIIHFLCIVFFVV